MNTNLIYPKGFFNLTSKFFNPPQKKVFFQQFCASGLHWAPLALQWAFTVVLVTKIYEKSPSELCLAAGGGGLAGGGGGPPTARVGGSLLFFFFFLAMATPPS